MGSQLAADVYTPVEIARAAGVSEAEVLAALRVQPMFDGGAAGGPIYVRHADAVRVARELVLMTRRGAGVVAGERVARTAPDLALFTLYGGHTTAASRSKGVPLALSSTLHAGLIAVIVLLTTLNLAPRAATLKDDRLNDPMRLVFVATPGPGGGGGGGGLLMKAPPPKAKREGVRKISSPIPPRREPKPVAPAPAPPPEPKPEPPKKVEPLPAVVAPIVAAPADPVTKPGVLEQTPVQSDSRGSGRGGGVGSGTGTGLGSGDGSGVGPGSGGGTGGGPYRPGSGIEPPRLLREVHADYTEEARQRGLSGEVVLEIVVRRDGSVGDVKMLRGLGAGLNERAVQAVRQWRFAPATRLGQPVDVIVEVGVEFKLR